MGFATVGRHPQDKLNEKQEAYLRAMALGQSNLSAAVWQRHMSRYVGGMARGMGTGTGEQRTAQAQVS